MTVKEIVDYMLEKGYCFSVCGIEVTIPVTRINEAGEMEEFAKELVELQTDKEYKVIKYPDSEVMATYYDAVTGETFLTIKRKKVKSYDFKYDHGFSPLAETKEEYWFELYGDK